VRHLSELGVGRILRGGRGSTPKSGAFVVGVLPGVGVGPEVVAAALDVLGAVADVGCERFEVRTGPEACLTPADQATSLSPHETEFCRALFEEGGALVCGPKAGRFVYELRARFGLFCKLTPVRPLAALSDTGALRAEAIREVDVLFVRENVGGLYFGSSEARREGGRLAEAHQAFHYTREQVDRILRIAMELAVSRRGRLAVVTKPGGVPAISALWQESASELNQDFGVELEAIEVDNACYQVVANAAHFDVVVSPNMFGDVLADTAALLLGSRGMSFSGNFAEDGASVYQTAHGAALDLAGSDRANPVGQIQSLAMLLEESFGRFELGAIVRRAIESVLAEGWRTADVMAPGCHLVGTRELGKRIAERTHAAASERELRAMGPRAWRT
jgi:3-isopropylmalate dehydrogenase